MPLDPDTRRYLDARALRGMPPTHLQTPQQHRGYIDGGPFPAGPALHGVSDTHLRAHDGHAVAVRVFRPSADPALPMLLFLHGGGWMSGTIDSVDGTLRHLALASGHVIVAIAYRRSPEHRYPAALNDALDAVDWMRAQAARLGGDATRLVVGGASAGGNLAAALALRARDQGREPPVAQLLIYPCLDPACDSDSFVRHAVGYVLTQAGMRWYWSHYLREEADHADPYAAPLKAEDLRGLPPAFIVTAEFDPLLDDGIRYAARLQAAGVAVLHRCYPGVVHGFFNQWHAMARGLTAIQDAGRWLAALQAGPATAQTAQRGPSP